MFQEKRMCDLLQKKKRYDFKVHAQMLANISLKLLLFLLKNSASILSSYNGQNAQKRSKEEEKEKEEKNKQTDYSLLVEFVNRVEPLLIYCYCYGKGDLFILASRCMVRIKDKRLSNFKKFGHFIITTSINILKNIPNYHSKKFNQVIVTSVNILIALLKSNPQEQVGSWLDEEIAYDENENEYEKEFLNQKNKRKRDGYVNEQEKKRRRKMAALLNDETLDKLYLNGEKVTPYGNISGKIRTLRNFEEEEYKNALKNCKSTLRYCLLSQIILLLNSRNYLLETVKLFKHIMLQENINEFIKNNELFFKMMDCVKEIFQIMIEESHQLKLAFFCGQIYVEFFLKFPLSDYEKKKMCLNLLKYLSSRNSDTRIVIMNTIYILLRRTDDEFLKNEYYYLFFATLLTNFANETYPKCKKMFVFLIKLLFKKVNDMNYIVSSYKLLKENMLCNEKNGPFLRVSFYLLPIFAIFFNENKEESVCILSSERENISNVNTRTKSQIQELKSEIKEVCSKLEVEIQNNEKNKENIEGEMNNIKTNLQKEFGANNHVKTETASVLDTIRTHFINELRRHSKELMKKKKEKGKKKETNKDKKGTKRETTTSYKMTTSYVFWERNLFCMQNILEDMFVLLVTLLMNESKLNIKSIFQKDKILLDIYTSTQTITFFMNCTYDVYNEINPNTLYLFYKLIEQNFSYIHVDIVEQILNQEQMKQKYIHKKYQKLCVKTKFLMDNEKVEPFLFYFLYFWNMILQNGIYNINPHIEVLSVKFISNFISQKIQFPFFPLLLIRLFSNSKLIINIIIEKMLSLVLHSYFLEHFHVYHKEIATAIFHISKLLLWFPWLTNGYEGKKKEEEVFSTNYIQKVVKSLGKTEGLTTKKNSTMKTGNEKKEKAKNYKSITNCSRNKKENGTCYDDENEKKKAIKNKRENKEKKGDKKSEGKEKRDLSQHNISGDDEDYKCVNSILEKREKEEETEEEEEKEKEEEEEEDMNFEIMETWDTVEKNQMIKKNNLSREEIDFIEKKHITKEILSYSKFFLIVMTISRAIGFHLSNVGKNFVRIYTILYIYKHMVLDFPVQLWNYENKIITLVMSALYKIASHGKRRPFKEEETIFNETRHAKKLIYLSTFAWHIIELLEKKMKNKVAIFNKAFLEARQQIIKKRFARKRRNKLMAVMDPKLFYFKQRQKRERMKLRNKKKKSDV